MLLGTANESRASAMRHTNGERTIGPSTHFSAESEKNWTQAQRTVWTRVARDLVEAMILDLNPSGSVVTCPSSSQFSATFLVNFEDSFDRGRSWAREFASQQQGIVRSRVRVKQPTLSVLEV